MIGHVFGHPKGHVSRIIARAKQQLGDRFLHPDQDQGFVPDPSRLADPSPYTPTLVHDGDLTDAEWDRVRVVIPPDKDRGRKRTTVLRSVVNAILYRARSGRAWRHLPRHHPRWSTIYVYYRRWMNDGTWLAIEEVLGGEVKIERPRDRPATITSADAP